MCSHSLFEALALEQRPPRVAGAFGVAPDEFVGVEVWGIAGQEMQRQLAIEFVHVVPYQACPVRGKAIDVKSRAIVTP